MLAHIPFLVFLDLYSIKLDDLILFNLQYSSQNSKVVVFFPEPKLKMPELFIRIDFFIHLTTSSTYIKSFILKGSTKKSFFLFL